MNANICVECREEKKKGKKLNLKDHVEHITSLVIKANKQTCVVTILRLLGRYTHFSHIFFSLLRD